MKSPIHPSKFSLEVLEEIAQIIWEYGPVQRALDPFAGTGRVHWLKLAFAVGVEIEPVWASMEPGDIVGNALCLPFPDDTFDCVVTSPVYGNRYADHHQAKDGSRRRSYTHDLRASLDDPDANLHCDNAGVLSWGDEYRDFHERAWTETLRTCRIGTLIVLNVSNHIRGHREQPVSEWHMNWFLDHGCCVEDLRRVNTPRHREGANYQARVDHENVFALRYVAPVLTPDNDDLQEIYDDAIAYSRGLDSLDGPELGGGTVDTGDGGAGA